MAFDKYGFIVNIDKFGNEIDYGDSCFFMGLQALCYILSGRIKDAQKLYELCYQYDFVRHPKVLNKENSYYKTKNQTSYDMILIWDWLTSRYPMIFNKEPPYKYRISKFFWGKHRNKIMYFFPFGFIYALIFFIIVLLFERFVLFKKFHKTHLSMLYLATIYEKMLKLLLNLYCKNRRISTFKMFLPILALYLGLCHQIINLIEKKIGYEHHFFRFLFYKRFDNKNPVPPGQTDWIYQRDLRVYQKNPDIIYHTENFDGEELDLSQQFYKFTVKRVFNILRLNNSFK